MLHDVVSICTLQTIITIGVHLVMAMIRSNASAAFTANFALFSYGATLPTAGILDINTIIYTVYRRPRVDDILGPDIWFLWSQHGMIEKTFPMITTTVAYQWLWLNLPGHVSNRAEAHTRRNASQIHSLCFHVYCSDLEPLSFIVYIVPSLVAERSRVNYRGFWLYKVSPGRNHYITSEICDITLWPYLELFWSKLQFKWE